MKKIQMLFLVIVFSSYCLIAQDLSGVHRKIGIGVPLFNLSEYLNESSMGNSIYLTINLKNKIRLEPMIGFSLSEDRSNYVFEVGAFKLKNIGSFQIHLGTRLGLSDGNKYIVAPTLGGEYYFIEHFSIGSEIQLRSTLENGNITVYTNPALLVRFYF